MRTFPFPYRANVVDRDALIIPAGWDSWGKIKVLRDVFDARGTSSAWQALLNQHIKHRDNELDVEAEQAGETLLNTWSHIVRDDSTQVRFAATKHHHLAERILPNRRRPQRSH